MLDLHKKLPAARTPYENDSLVGAIHESPLRQRQIDAADAEIDRLVYELYGLTEEEIRIVEGKGV
jgi:RecB family exonuclease